MMGKLVMIIGCSIHVTHACSCDHLGSTTYCPHHLKFSLLATVHPSCVGSSLWRSSVCRSQCFGLELLFLSKGHSRDRSNLCVTQGVRVGWGAADAQTAHHATFSTAPARQRLGSANAETTPAGAPAAAADRTQQPDATCEGKNG